MNLLTQWPREQLCCSHRQRQEVVRAVERAFASALESLKIDLGLVDLLEQIYVPLGAWLVCRMQQQEGPLVVGVNGAQGAGKSTLFNLLESILCDGFGLKVVGFSIDDLYKTRAERAQLGEEVHPLLATRGVPGTHDIELGIHILNSLRNSDDSTVTGIPVFDKATDDRCPEAVWQEWAGPADIIIFEGWCVGSLPQHEHELAEPVNTLEREEDPDGHWRRYVNTRLRQEYQQLNAMLDVLLMLKVPSMDAVFEWRSLQEQKLAERVRYFSDTQQPTDHLRIMDEQQIQRFIQHYERLTCHTLQEMPTRADVVMMLNENHKISEIQINHPLSQCKGVDAVLPGSETADREKKQKL
ncbi:MAG: hypothetical protein OIF57_07975 [Marinobacterium sp.]|nr:hypothetical protein [Marinobacterium sp.]